MLSLVLRRDWVENRIISRLDSLLYTGGIIYYTGICYTRNICVESLQKSPLVGTNESGIIPD